MTVLARADGVLGELVLRRPAGAERVELVSNGVFLMDSGDGTTERRLATTALDALPAPSASGWHVVVAGLGLGFTTSAVLDDPRVAQVTVVEVEPALVDWVQRGLVPGATGLLDDARVDVAVGDVADVLPALAPRCAHAVLLDVDNGPGFLVHPGNARVYSAEFLRVSAGRLAAGGVLALWSADPSQALEAELRAAVGTCVTERLSVEREGRLLDYWLYVAATS